MKNHWRFFRLFLITDTLCVHTLRAGSCAFPPVFQMMKCFLIACGSMQTKWEIPGAGLCSVSMILGASTHLTCIQSAVFFVNKRLIRCYLMLTAGHFQSGRRACRTWHNGGRNGAASGWILHGLRPNSGALRSPALLVLRFLRVTLPLKISRCIPGSTLM